ncbi:MAG: hypothetical protein KGJ33_00250 [Patescibacteria group bacterium]|nr:hypothetical protein [Patescibacteria group bacterium]
MKKSKNKPDAYAQSGVNLSAGDIFSEYAAEIGRASFGNSRFVQVIDQSGGHFRGQRGWQYKNLPEGSYHVGGTDGIGTATILVSAAGADETAASRLVAMTAGDLTRYGALPLVFLNTLEVKTLGEPRSKLFERYRTMMGGLGRYASEQHFVLMGGETAEMNDCVSSEITGDALKMYPAYNWSGAMVGVNHPDLRIDLAKVRPGQVIIALQDMLGSNGGSLARRFLRQTFGRSWWLNPKARATVAEMASPARLYDGFLTLMNGWYNEDFKPIVPVTAIAHLTGGGIRKKFFEDILVRIGISAELDRLFLPPEFMLNCYESQKLTDEEGYTFFSGGQRLLAVMAEEHAMRFTSSAVDHGIPARIVGRIGVWTDHPFCTVHSQYSGKIFRFRP